MNISHCRLSYLLAGGLHPVGFHVPNIILHAVISALMIDVFAILIGGLVYDENGCLVNNAPKTSLLAALFFAAHPVHTESVRKVQKVFRSVYFCSSVLYIKPPTCFSLTFCRSVLKLCNRLLGLRTIDVTLTELINVLKHQHTDRLFPLETHKC